MLRQPKKVKYNKYFKPRHFPKPWNRMKELQPSLTFSLVALESSFLNYRQIESARQIIRRTVKRRGKLEIFFLPDIGVSNKSLGARMGKGKGKVKRWIGPISAGKTVFKLMGLKASEAIPALKKGANKLPLALRIY